VRRDSGCTGRQASLTQSQQAGRRALSSILNTGVMDSPIMSPYGDAVRTCVRMGVGK